MDPNQPPSYPTPGPAAPTPTAYPLQPKHKKGNRLVLIGVVGVLLVLIVVIVIVVLSSNKTKTPTTTTQEQEQTVEPEGPQPATAVDTEQTNNAISQDITSVNDDKDLPATQWDDRTIGL